MKIWQQFFYVQLYLRFKLPIRIRSSHTYFNPTICFVFYLSFKFVQKLRWGVDFHGIPCVICELVFYSNANPPFNIDQFKCVMIWTVLLLLFLKTSNWWC